MKKTTMFTLLTLCLCIAAGPAMAGSRHFSHKKQLSILLPPPFMLPFHSLIFINNREIVRDPCHRHDRRHKIRHHRYYRNQDHFDGQYRGNRHNRKSTSNRRQRHW